ncbi:MAG TPA: hypothetical protein VFM44_03545 [Gemmatimonadota bacterium]|nr:hypothetical protein [Gemmatimonadota bacterium]
MRRSILSVVLLFCALGCGDAVTDPSRAGFEGNPRLIEGDWATLFITNQGVTRYDAELLPAGGEFLGEFRFFRAGREVRIAFNDGTWDGTRLDFTTDPLPGTSIPGPIEWTALYFPAGSTGQDVPTRLLLSSVVIGGPSFPIEFVRPADLDWLETH